MKIAIMQPYFLPYIGYFQLINAVDIFVIYDNIQYTKRGWINRNRFLQNGKDALFTIPLEKDSHYLDINKRMISPEFKRAKLLSQFENSYAKAQHRKEMMPIIKQIINHDQNNLFKYIYNSIENICQYLDIDTEFVISSQVNIDHTLKSKDKVIAICKKLNAYSYINPIGGKELYSKEEFKEQGIEINFLRSRRIEYPQFENEFIPWLSIIDVMMFNPKEEVKTILVEFEIK